MDEAQLDEALRALSHRERRMFIAAALSAPRAAGELAEMSQLSAATASEHLKVLRKSGLMEVDKSGRYWMYATNRERLRQVIRALRELGKANGT